MSKKEKQLIFQTIAQVLTKVVFYNFYSGAEKDFRQRKFPTITESYKNVLSTIYYSIGDVNDNNYVTLLKSIMTGFEASSIHYSTPHSFIQDLSVILIPSQFLDSYDKKQRENMVRAFITKVMFDTIHIAGNEFLPKIIDDRDKLESSENKQLMVQQILKFIESHKNDIYNSCIDKTAKYNPSQYSAIVENLKKKNTELQTELEATKIALQKTSALVKQHADKAHHSNFAIIEFGKKIDEMNEQIKLLQSENNSLRMRQVQDISVYNKPQTHVITPKPHVQPQYPPQQPPQHQPHVQPHVQPPPPSSVVEESSIDEEPEIISSEEDEDTANHEEEDTSNHVDVEDWQF